MNRLAVFILLVVSFGVTSAYGDCLCTCNQNDLPLGNCEASDCAHNCAGPSYLTLLPGFALRDSSNEVGWVAPGSPAELAGLQRGDVVVTMNGNSIPGLCQPESSSSDVYVVRRKESVLRLSVAR